MLRVLRVGNRTLTESPSGRTTLTWDAQNRLTRFENGAAAVDYAYNAFDQRVKRTTSSITQKYVFDLDRILARLNAAGQTDRLAVVTNEEYGRLLTEQTAGGTEHHLYDALGSTVSLAGDGGSLTDTYRYRAFGEELSHSGSSESPYTFVGRWGYNYDSVTGLYLARSRWLDPATGTWLSSDPLDSLLGDPNRYRYALNNPIGLIDPSGEIAFLPILTFVGKSALAGTVSGGLNALIAWICGRDPWQAFKEGFLPGALSFGVASVLSRVLGRVLPAWAARLSTVVSEAGTSAITQYFTIGEVSLSQTLIDTGIGLVATRGTGFRPQSSRSRSSFKAGSRSPGSGGWTFANWFKFWRDKGGRTRSEPIGRIPFIRRWNSRVVSNADAPGTPGRADTAWHEGTHVVIGRYLPQVKDAGELPIVGGAVKYGEELVAYTVGHLRVGRLHALPAVPIEALQSLNWQQRVELAATAYLAYTIANEE